MAMINCPECGKNISDAAKMCPYCGYPIEELRKSEDKHEENSVTKRVKTSVLTIIGALSSALGMILTVIGYNKMDEADGMLDALDAVGEWSGYSSSTMKSIAVWSEHYDNYKIMLIIGAVILVVGLMMLVAGLIHDFRSNNG